MNDQPIFDNEIFFQEYKTLRETENNYNDLLEQPTMEKLLPDLQGKTVLDLGCGYGKNCLDFIQKGAERVVGIDVSEKMLAVARSKYSHKKIEYLTMDIDNVSLLNEKFDFIYSSLAFHYVEDFSKLAINLHKLLDEDGRLLFSQEHPLVTATIDGKQHYNKDGNGNYCSFTFSNYGQGGRRDTFWYMDGVIKYHRTLGEIVTALANANFIIETVSEPLPSKTALEKMPSLVKEYVKPTFLIVKARKANF